MGLVHHIAASIALMLVVDHFSLLPEIGLNPLRSAINSDVTRPAKGNRLLPSRPGSNRMRIVGVEIIGLDDAAILYRDRKGKILFRNDPLTSTTVIAKNVELPEVTILDRHDIAVPKSAITPPSAQGSKLPIGCDPAFGPLVDTPLRTLTGRCMTEGPHSPRFATVWSPHAKRTAAE